MAISTWRFLRQRKQYNWHQGIFRMVFTSNSFSGATTLTRITLKFTIIVANTLAYKDVAIIYKTSPLVIWSRCRSNNIKKMVKLFDQFFDQNFNLSTKLIFKVCEGWGTNRGSLGFFTYFFSLYQWDIVIYHYPDILKRIFCGRNYSCGIISMSVCVWLLFFQY